MADSVPDRELQDVLSSVRRLVSQELKLRDNPSKSAPGALVLTDKDRVAKDHAARVSTRSLEQRIAELEAAVEDSDEEFEPDGSEDQSVHRPDRMVYSRPRPSEHAVRRIRSTMRPSEAAFIGTADDAGKSDKDEPTVAFHHDRRASVIRREAPMAEDVPTVPAKPAEVHAFSDPDDVVARIEARIESGPDLPPPPAPFSESDAGKDAAFDAELAAAVRSSIAREESGDEKADEPAATDIAAADEDTPGPEQGAPDDIDDAPEQPEAPMGKIPTADVVFSRTLSRGISKTVEPPHGKLPEPEGKAEPLRLTPDHKAEDDAGAEEQPGTATAAAALDALPDEEAMRLLVTRLLREELRGELGERITRNVRKLVRSEIKRILEARDLD